MSLPWYATPPDISWWGVVLEEMAAEEEWEMRWYIEVLP